MTDAATSRAVGPLPFVTPHTEFFWAAGEAGELRFQRCTGCGALCHPPGPSHPPGPICADRRSRGVETAAVSGLGTAVGVSVNHHP